MATPEEEALAREIMQTVSALLEAVLHSDGTTVAASLAPDSLLGVGMAIFGMDALAVPLGLASRPQSMGLTSVQAADDLAVAEVSGRDAQDRDSSVASVFLVRSGDGWQVADIWPVPADYDLDVEHIAEPTALFYTGQLQLTVAPDADLDDVESLLIPSLQQNGLGLHLIERSVHLWRMFKLEGSAGTVPAAVWAAALHFAALAIDGQDPDPEKVAGQYGIPAEVMVERFMQLVSRMGFSPEEEAAPPAPPSSGLVDLSGRPLSSERPGENRRPHGGIILPGG